MAMFEVTLNLVEDVFTDQVSNIYDAPIWFGDIVLAGSESMLLIGNNDFGAKYGGTFTYRNGVLTSGRVTSFEFYVDAQQDLVEAFNGTIQYKINSINGEKGVSAKKLFTYAQTGDSQSALKYIMAKADMIYGSGFDNKPVDETLYGWGGKDTIFGLAGNDVIGGGAGKDQLYGGNGSDYFFIDSALRKHADVIADFGFSGVRDKIVLLASAFNGLETGELDAERFVLGSTALEEDDRILLDGNKVYFDPDGTGSLMPGLIATIKYAEVNTDDPLLIGIHQLEASDFIIVQTLQSLG